MKSNVTIDDILKGINLVSYEIKKVNIDIDYLLMLKNEIQNLRVKLKAKDITISNLKKQVNDLTARQIKQIPDFDLYI